MRVSTTTLESFRLFMTADWMSEQALLDTIAGKFEPTPAVLLGQAFGQVLETPERFQVPGGYQHPHGYTFDEATMAPALALIDRRGVCEAKALKPYGPVDVVAMADHLLGTHLSEFKTTLSTFDFDKYAASYQWRFMVDIFAPASVSYHVFLLDDRAGSTVTLKGIESFNLFPYPALHQDCCDLLAEFVDYVHVRGLDGLLRERQRVAEAA
jgi:hypothetical protein